MTIRRRVWLGGFLSVLTAVFVSSSESGRGVQAQSGGTPEQYLAVSSQAEIVEYWTPARMAAATPVNPVVSTNAPLTVGGASGGAPGAVEAGGPDAQAARARALTAAGQGEVEPAHEPYHGAIPFTRWQYAAKYRSYPVSTIAKIFFTNSGGNYVCSGASIGLNAVWTAGHCVVNTVGNGAWSTNVLVCPSYDNGVNAGVGCWAGVGSWSWCPQWCTNGSFEYDFGAINTSTCGTVHCTSIGNRTSWLGLAWNWTRNLNWIAMGYPQGAPFNGNKIQVATSSFGYEDTASGIGPNSTAMGNDLTGGSSGGPWIWKYGTNNYINGHNDWRHTAIPNEMATPYYDCRAVAMYNAVNGSNLVC